MENEMNRLPGVGPSTERVLKLVSGKNATFVKRVAKQQYERYGNHDIFDVSVRDGSVTVSIGENWITFWFREDGTVRDTIGYGQGSRYHKQMEDIAREVFQSHPGVFVR